MLLPRRIDLPLITGLDRLHPVSHADKKKRPLGKIAKNVQRASEHRKLFPIPLSQIFAATSEPPSRAMAPTQIAQFKPRSLARCLLLAALYGHGGIPNLSPRCEQKRTSARATEIEPWLRSLSGRTWSAHHVQHERLHCGLPFVGIVLSLGQFGDVEGRVAQGDQLAPAGRFD